MSAALDYAPYDVVEAEYEYDDLPPRSVISRNMVDNPDELHLNSKEGLYL